MFCACCQVSSENNAGEDGVLQSGKLKRVWWIQVQGRSCTLLQGRHSPPPRKASRHPEVLAPVRVLEWLPLVVSKAFEQIVGSRYSRREKLIPPAQLVS